MVNGARNKSLLQQYFNVVISRPFAHLLHLLRPPEKKKAAGTFIEAFSFDRKMRGEIVFAGMSLISVVVRKENK